MSRSIIIKQVNPFGPLTGAWSGPNTQHPIIYYIGDSPFYTMIENVDARRLCESNKASFEEFKNFYKAGGGRPRRVSRGMNFTWFYSVEAFFQFASSKGFGIDQSKSQSQGA